MKYSLIYFLCFAFILTSCVIQKPKPLQQQVKKQILILGPETKTCDADVMRKQCYQVKWSEDQTTWEYFYNEIKGFTYKPGYVYKLLVAIEPIDNPPADASSLHYSLIRVLQKKSICNNSITESEVLQLLKEKDLLLFPKGLSELEIAKTPSYQPKARFDLTKCIWTVSSSTYEAVTYENECANTNGCTPEIRLTVKVNAKTLAIIDQKEERILHPNYE